MLLLSEAKKELKSRKDEEKVVKIIYADLPKKTGWIITKDRMLVVNSKYRRI